MLDFIILYYLFISILLCILLYKMYTSNYKIIETFGNKKIIEAIFSKSEPQKTKMFNKVYYTLLTLKNPSTNIKSIVDSINKKEDLKKQFVNLKTKYDTSFESFVQNIPKNIKELKKYMNVYSKDEFTDWTKKTSLIRNNIKLFNSFIIENTSTTTKKEESKDVVEKEVTGCDLYKKGYVNFIDSKKIFTTYNEGMSKLYDKYVDFIDSKQIFTTYNEEMNKLFDK